MRNHDGATVLAQKWSWQMAFSGEPIRDGELWQKCLDKSQALRTDMGSFGCARLAPHFAQDDRVGELLELMRWTANHSCRCISCIAVIGQCIPLSQATRLSATNDPSWSTFTANCSHILVQQGSADGLFGTTHSRFSLAVLSRATREESECARPSLISETEDRCQGSGGWSALPGMLLPEFSQSSRADQDWRR